MLTHSLYRFYLFFAATGHWLLRRLTPGGWLILTGLLLTAGFGADPDRAIAYQAFTMLFSLLGIAMLGAPFFRLRVSARRLLPRFGSVGQPLAYPILVRNPTARRQSGLALLENIANPPLSFEEFAGPSAASKSFRLTRSPAWLRPALLKETPLPNLAPNSETSVTAQLIPLKRGPLRFTGLTMARPDPFGLFRAFINIPAAQSVLILPRRYPLPPIALPGVRKYQLGGVALAMSVGESEEFVSLRDYRRGDPLRHIHWKSWAKVGKPIVREFEDEFFVRHALLLDTFARSPHADLFEEAVSVAASFACTVSTQESLLDLMFIGTRAVCFTTGRSVAHSEQMLEILASVQPCRDKPFSDLQNLVLEHSGLLSGCICVFLAWDAPRQELVRRLQSLGLSLLVLVIVEPGAAERLKAGRTVPSAPPLPDPLANDPASFHVLEMGKIEEGLRKMTNVQ